MEWNGPKKVNKGVATGAEASREGGEGRLTVQVKVEGSILIVLFFHSIPRSIPTRVKLKPFTSLPAG